MSTADFSMSIDEAARYTGISRDVIYAACRSGALPAGRNGVRWVIIRSNLEAWVRSLPSDVE